MSRYLQRYVSRLSTKGDIGPRRRPGFSSSRGDCALDSAAGGDMKPGYWSALRGALRYCLLAHSLVGLVLLVGGLTLNAGCRRSPPSDTSAEVTYDPLKDPLVNPPLLFEQPPDDLSQIATEETLYLTLGANPNTANPLFGSSTYDFLLAGALFTGPFTFDKDMQWKVNDDFVESFEESEDHTVFTMKLRPGLTWHDGTPLTAHDIVFSWRQILDPQVPCPAQKPGTEAIKECVALDDLTVQYVQPTPLATRHWNLLFSIIPKHIYEKHKDEYPDLMTGGYYNRQNRQPVGSGPYRMVEWVENSRIVLERWEGYQGRKPYFQRIIFRIIPDDNVALLSFEKQEVDVVDSLSAQKFALETGSPSFAQVGCKAWGVQWAFSYIGWNMDGSNPFFGDRRVRYAMTHALNVPLILEKVSYNLSTPSDGIYHPDSWMYNPRVQRLEYDPQKSAALLDEAGWTVDPRDGWRYKNIDGRKTPFEFTLTMAQESPTAPQIAAIFQDDLKRLGVRMRTQRIEWSAFVEKTRKHEFQASMAGWGTGTDPDTGWNLWRTEEYETGRNYGGYSNPRVDELFELGRREFDFEKRREIYQEIHKLIYEDQPYTWISNPPTLAVFNRRIHGVQLSPRGIFNFDPGHTGWWVRGGQTAAAAMP